MANTSTGLPTRSKTLNRNKRDLADAILRLEGDPAFQKLKNEFLKTNFFKILGAGETERIHSNFWAWIFDPEGSHGLGDFAVRRLITMAADDQGNIIAQRLGRKLGGDDKEIEWGV